MIVTTTTGRELIHWFWLWALAAIVVAITHGRISGHEPATTQVAGEQQPDRYDHGSRTIPMPNVDQPDAFRHPHHEDDETGEAPSLRELLVLHRTGKFEQALMQWRSLDVTEKSETWRQTAMGAIQLRLGHLDEALECLDRAADMDPNNAVAEYLMGRVRQAQGRQIPYWHEKELNAPFHLASIRVDRVSSGSRSGSVGIEPRNKPQDKHPKMFLPHYIDESYSRLARQHFRRAVMMAPKCRFDQVIELLPPKKALIQFASQQFVPAGAITVGDLLDSFDERDFATKARKELGVKRTPRIY